MSTRTQFEDADLTHPWAVRYRIPVVRGLHPAWRYEVALAVPGGESRIWDLIWPAEAEARLVGSLIDFRRSYYNDSWQRRMLERPLDVDSGTNTIILGKRPGGWTYRKATWETGPFPYYSTPDEMKARFTPDPAGLRNLIDHIYSVGDRVSPSWVDWKSAHPEVWT